MRKHKGFTLLEILVALAILALVMVVLAQTVGASSRGYQHLDNKMLAWLAANDKLVEMQVYSQWPNVGTQTSKATLGDKDWVITTEITVGPFEGTREVTITARFDDDAKDTSRYRLTSLIGQPFSTITPEEGKETGEGAP